MRNLTARLLAPLLAAGLPTLVLAPQALAQEREQEPLAAEAAFDSGRWLRAQEPVAVQLNRTPGAGTGRLAVFVGRTDVTALTRHTGDQLVYHPAGPELPDGETDISIHVVSSSGEWREIGRFPVRILNRGGYRELGMAPAVEIISDGDFDRGQELTFNFGLAGTASRPGWSVRTQANAVGVTRDEQRLRFAERGLDAPAVDLSDYLVEIESGPVTAALGHVSFGESRHLISGFASRGASAGVRVGRVAHVGMAAINGSSMVGWSNPLGLNSADHRMLAGGLALELLPSSPGTMHLDATVLDGSLLPQAGYNQGVVNDAERGRGVGLQLAVSDPSRRARLGAGFTRATFTNPADPLLAQGAELVPVRSTTRNAQYVEASLDVLRNLAVRADVMASLTAGVRHERVDPLYRSIAASSQADVQRNVYEATASVGQLSLQYAHGRMRDNLDDVASILTTHTRDHTLSGALPIGALFRASYDAWWWPTLSTGYQTTHQRGGGIPVDGGFSESHVPDQVSNNLTLSLAWQRGAWDLTYQHNASDQDNRQPGREAADFEGRVHGLSLGVQPFEPLRVSLDLSDERQRSIEFDQQQRARRIGVSGDWRVLRFTTLQGNVSYVRAEDRPLTQEGENVEMRLEASQGFHLYRRTESGSQGRLFVRFARSRAWSAGPAAFAPGSTVWSVASGMSLRLY